jgi:hypothetical protein
MTYVIRINIMSGKALTEETVAALRAGIGRLDQQRAKLEKIQRMRQALEELGFAGRQCVAEAGETA